MDSLTSTDSWSILKYHLNAWRLLGIYPPAVGGCRLFYFIYSIALNLTVTILFPFTLIIPAILATNLADFCESCFILIPDILCSMKFIQTWHILDRLLALRPRMLYLDQQLNLPSEHHTVQTSLYLIWRIFAVMVGLFFCLWASTVMRIIFSNGQQLTFPGWFPWDWQSTKFRFGLTNCFQFGCLTVQCIQDICSDSYPLTLLSMVGAHIRALGIRVQNIGNNTEYRSHRRQAEAQAELIACIKDHKLLLKLLDTVLAVISTTCLFQFFCTALSVCTLCGFALFADLNFTALINIFFFFAVIVMETLLVCCSGEIIYNECEQLTTAIYSCKWYNQDVKFQRTLLLMMYRSQKIKDVMAANVISVRLSTFVAVMKGSYSMFTLLCNMNSK